MSGANADIIARLQREIMPLQGFRPLSDAVAPDLGLGPMRSAFPNAVFPLGAVHEFLCEGQEGIASTTGFLSGLTSRLMMNGAVGIWISTSRQVYPPALKRFGIAPDKIIFIDLKKEKDLLWVTEESLKCEGIAVVVAEVQELDFTSSRRFQLAVEKSKVTSMILRKSSRKPNANAALSRWKIRSLPSTPEEGLPGVGFPRWKVDLLKIRNGTPGSWEVQWAGNAFRFASKQAQISVRTEHKKTG